MEIQSRRMMKVQDIFQCDRSLTFGTYEMKYNQDTCHLHRFPELYWFFEKYNLKFEYSNGWGFARIKFDRTTVLPDAKELAKLLYDCFSTSRGISIGQWTEQERSGGYGPHLYSTGTWVDETFEEMRNRKLFDLRDYLGILHGGKGIDSIRLYSKRYPKPIDYQI